MSEALHTYIRDHLAGASFAVDMVTYLGEMHAGESLGRFAAELLDHIKDDQRTLRELAEQLGADPGSFKHTVAWLGEKASRLKFHRASSGAFGTFEALEFLALGIFGKRLLWLALHEAAATNARLAGMEFEQLIARAESQFEEVQRHRLAYARQVFGGSDAS